MKSLWIILTLVGQFQVEELPEENQPAAYVFQVEELALVKATAKPHLELLGASWCVGCKSTRAAVDAIKKESLPFTYAYRDIDAKGDLGAKEIPAWAYNGRVFQYGFSTPENLIENLKKVTQPKALVLRIRLTNAQLIAFAHSYNGPEVGVRGNNFWHHLQEGTHGFTAQQLNGLTQWECAKIHGAHHNGYLTPFSIGGK